MSDLGWKEPQRPALIEGLMSSGLIPVNQAFVKPYFNDGNLKTRPKQSNKVRKSFPKPETRRPATSISIKRKNSPDSIHSQQKNHNKQALTGRDHPKTSFSITSRSVSRADKENYLPPITELVSTERKFSTVRDIHHIINEYHRITDNDPGISENLEPLKQAEILTESMKSTFVVWNKANTQVRTFSEDLALLLNDLKGFIQTRFSNFPAIFKTYGNRIVEVENIRNRAVEDNKNLKAKIQYLEVSLKESNERLIDANEEIEIKTIEIVELKGAVETAEYNKDSALSDLNTMETRLKKSEMQRSKLRQKNAELQIENDNLIGTINELKERVHQLEVDGGNLRPLLEKTRKENQDLLKQIEGLQDQIKVLSYKPPTEDIGTNTNTNDKHLKGKKKGKKIPLDARSNSTILNNFSSPHNDNSRSNYNMTRHGSVFLPTEMKFIAKPIEPIVEKERIEEEEEPPAPELEVANEEESVQTPKEETKVVEEEKEEKEEKIEVTKEKQLPKDYNINNNIEINNDVMISYVNRLLPLPLSLTLTTTSNSELEKALNVRTESRSYSWMLRHIMDFFQSMSGIDNIDNVDTNSVEIIKQQMLDKSGLPNVAKKMYAELLASVNFFEHTSQSVKFFSSFIKQEYSIVDLKFFKMLMNVCFGFIYPSVQDTLDNLDLTPYTTQFLIHIDIANRVREAFFPHIKHRSDEDRKLIKETRNSPHPSLISFWTYADHMIELFRETELRFHHQVDGIISLVGWEPLKEMTKDCFTQFFIIIDPSIPQNTLHKMWEKYSLDRLRNMKDNEKSSKFDSDMDLSYEKSNLTRFCSDYPDITSKILNLQYTEKLEIKITNLSAPLLKLLKFLRTRYTHFLKEIELKLDGSVKVILHKTLLQFRNSLIRCDISSAISCYMKYLQLLDLKLAEQYPYFVLSPTISTAECEEVQKMLMARESLICINFGISAEKLNE